MKACSIGYMILRNADLAIQKTPQNLGGGARGRSIGSTPVLAKHHGSSESMV